MQFVLAAAAAVVGWVASPRVSPRVELIMINEYLYTYELIDRRTHSM